MSMWVAVHGLVDGQDVAASTFNRPYFELTERTNYLYGRVQELLGLGLFEAVKIYEVPLNTVTPPVIGDVVYLDPTTRVYSKAVATISSTDLFVAGAASYALGVLVDIAGSTGTVLLSGRLPLTTNGIAWSVADLVETGETFRNGPYYLSLLQPGKLTATPSGPAVYIGTFQENIDNPGYGAYAVVNPQFRDMAQSHVHRAYVLHPQPAGQHSVNIEDPTGRHFVLGFGAVQPPDMHLVWEEPERIPRLVIVGAWRGTGAADYTVVLTDAGGVSPPTGDWSDSYLKWTSSDPAEGSGIVKVFSYEVPVAIGTKGLYAVLENPTAETPLGASEWENGFEVSVDAADKRTWQFTAPTAVQGWQARRFRQVFEGVQAADQKYSFRIVGGPMITEDKRISDTFTIKNGPIWILPFASSELGGWTDGDLLNVGAFTFEFDSDATVTAGNTSVTIGVTDTETFTNLLAAMLTTVEFNFTPVYDEDEQVLLLCSDAVDTVEFVHIIGAVTETISPEPGTDLGAQTLDGNADFIIYDEYNHNLVQSYGTPYWANVGFWQAVALKNQLTILSVPFSASGETATGDDVTTGDTWTCEIDNEAPGAEFVYALGMHQALAQFYPPVPRDAATLTLNGVELDAAGLFPQRPTYAIGTASIYWFNAGFSSVPWPEDWVSTENTGSDYLQKNLLFSFVRMSMGSTGVVTSLQPAPDSPIRVLQCGTSENGTVGDLMLDVDFSVQIVDTEQAGYRVVKSAQGTKLLRGPVVERIRAGAGIAITQSTGAPTGQGIVTVGLAANAGYGGDFTEIALENAKEEKIGMFNYIRLLGWNKDLTTNVPSGFTAKFRVPHTLPDLPYAVYIYATVFGEQNQENRAFAGVNFSYEILPDYTALSTDDDAPSTSNLKTGLLRSPLSLVHIPFGENGGTYTAYDPLLIHNDSTTADVAQKTAHILGDAFPVLAHFPAVTGLAGVRPGSLIGVRFSRAAESDGTEYTSSIGFINLRWVLRTND